MANDKKNTGFSGLDAMVSEVGPALEPSVARDQGEATSATTAVASEPAEAHEVTSQAPSKSGSAAAGWVIAIPVFAIFLVLITFISTSGSSSNSQSAATYETPASGTDNAPTLASHAPSAANQPGNSAPAAVQNAFRAPSQDYSPAPTTESASASDEELVPPIGSGLTLDRSQIRYCMSQRIRLEAWQGQLNANPQTLVDAFNASVNFYNARCSSYRYRTGDLESVRAEVELNRAALTQQGLSMAASANASVPVQNTPAIKTSFDCAKARSDAERLICNDTELAAADIELASLFASAKSTATDQDAFKEHARVQWNYRERNCHDRDCLTQWYATQRQWLTGIVSNPRGSAQPGEPAPSQSAATPAGNCTTTVACAKAMLVFAGSENLAGAMQAAKTIDLLPKPQRGDRATARKLNQDGLSALNASRPDDAVKLLEQANQADPGDEEIASNLSYAYAMNGQLAKSEDTAVAALSLNPRRTNVWAPLAVTLAKENRLDQATQAMWLAYQFSTDKQRTLNFIDSRLAIESDPAVLKMYSSSKTWLTKNIKPNF
ncbi:hypothetical protein BC1002_0128 [Paraburkholderia atlantica]|uniref:Uncharacterized protein n=1 Tax=Paraburkholderia atlantica TaxID=2654982 RepID=D5WA14_PARAM|nr:tetratricopeptide repeat protein [Paraburkholderia atlantica]ADG14236.1 hypothetical protein BC1002_0128 [Paraburkholderia atlantica]